MCIRDSLHGVLQLVQPPPVLPPDDFQKGGNAIRLRRMPQPFQSFRPAAAKGIEGQNLRLQGLVRPPRIFIPKCQKIRVLGLIKLCKRILHGLVPEDGGFLLASHPDLCRDAQNRRIFPDDFDGEFMDRADIRQLDIFRLGRQPGVFRCV